MLVVSGLMILITHHPSILELTVSMTSLKWKKSLVSLSAQRMKPNPSRRAAIIPWGGVEGEREEEGRRGVEGERKRDGEGRRGEGGRGMERGRGEREEEGRRGVEGRGRKRDGEGWRGEGGRGTERGGGEREEEEREEEGRRGVEGRGRKRDGEGWRGEGGRGTCICTILQKVLRHKSCKILNVHKATSTNVFPIQRSGPYNILRSKLAIQQTSIYMYVHCTCDPQVGLEADADMQV